MQRLMTTLLVTGGFVLLANAANPIYFWQLANVHADLTRGPLNNDLIESFTELGPNEGDEFFVGAEPVLANQMINESFNYVLDPFLPGFIWNDPNIDPFDLGLDPNELYNTDAFLLSYLIPQSPAMPCGTSPTADDLLFGVGQRSDGFGVQFGTTGSIDDFNNGVIGPGTSDGLLRDDGRASLVLRYGFSSPTDIGAIRVIGGNINDSDTRTFHHYDVWVSTDGLGPAGTYTRIAKGVKSGEFGYGNIDDCQTFGCPPGIAQDDPNTLSWFASLTELRDFDSKTLVAGATDIRIVFYCTGSGSNFFADPWNGYVNEDPGWVTTCGELMHPEDNDGIKWSFVASVIQEIDVLGPNDDTPWGDINRDDYFDMVDFTAYQQCSGGLSANGCYRFDQNENSGLDSTDLDTFEAQMTGPLDPTMVPAQFFNGVDAAL
jgi:hypothetical protein